MGKKIKRVAKIAGGIAIAAGVGTLGTFAYHKHKHAVGVHGDIFMQDLARPRNVEAALNNVLEFNRHGWNYNP
jgi:hypothetical protein